jgi:nuclear pore complex protein Nup98-Nup96
MARFSANITDSEDEEELHHRQPPEPSTTERFGPPLPLPVEDEPEGSASSSSSSSEMQEEELISSIHRKRSSRARNTLIEDDDDEIEHAHEINKPQPLSKNSPPRQQRGNPTIIPWAQQLGVDAQKMHVMQTSLFRMPEEAAAMRAMKSKPVTSVKKLQLPSQPMNRKHSRDSDGDGLRMDPKEVRGRLRKSVSLSDVVIRGHRLRTTSKLCLIDQHGNMHAWIVGHLL